MFKKCTPLWREARLEATMLKTMRVRNAFVSWDVQKVQAVVVQNTFRSAKRTIPGALLEVETFQKCMPLWREAHFEVKFLTAGIGWTVSDHFWQLRCRKSALWHEGHFEVNMLKTAHARTTFGPSRHHTATTTTTATAATTITTVRYTTLDITRLQCTTLHAVHYITLSYATLLLSTLQLQLQTQTQLQLQLH